MSHSNASPDPTSLDVIQVRFVDGHVLDIAFSNGRSGRHDFSEITSRSGRMISPLFDPAYFRRVFIEDGVLTWPNGYDWDSTSLYREMVEAGEIAFEAAE